MSKPTPQDIFKINLPKELQSRHRSFLFVTNIPKPPHDDMRKASQIKQIK